MDFQQYFTVNSITRTYKTRILNFYVQKHWFFLSGYVNRIWEGDLSKPKKDLDIDVFCKNLNIIELRWFCFTRSTIVLYFSIVVLSTVLFLFLAISRSIRGLCKGCRPRRFSVENPISRFPEAFPDPSPRKVSVYERTRPLTKLNSNGESALILRQQPCVVNTAQFSIFLLRQISKRI